MTRAVLFDLDGVLVTSYEAWFRILNAAAQRWGYPAITREQYQAVWGQSVDADVRTFFSRHTPAEVAVLYDELLPDFVRLIDPNPEAAEVLATLQDKRVKTAVVTNSPHELARRVLDTHGLHADTLVGGNDVENAKPAPDMLLLACRRFTVDKSEVLLVGDSRFDRDAARAAGMRFIGLDTEGDERIQRLTEIFDLL